TKVEPVSAKPTTAAAKAPAIPADTVAVFTPAPTPIVRGARLTGVRTFGIVMDGTKMEFDVPGRVSKGIPTAPVRYLFEHKGLNVQWNQKDKTVTAKNDAQALWLQIGNPIAKINGKDLTMESTPYLFKSRTFVPLSFVGEALDVDAMYDAATNHVMILSRKNVAKTATKDNAK
ncbi:MAG: copper amine oxidase N-terminal domain-containing protein, partial [Armatimonadota bacterium]